MDTGDRDKLDELLELSRENNKILRAMKRRAVWNQVMTIIYWLIILGVAGWSYYIIQPYLVKYLTAYESIMGSMNSLNDKTQNLPDMNKLLQAIQ
jgi:hypothetical protein